MKVPIYKGNGDNFLIIPAECQKIDSVNYLFNYTKNGKLAFMMKNNDVEAEEFLTMCLEDLDVTDINLITSLVMKDIKKD